MGYRWRRILVGGLFVVLLPVALTTLLVMVGPEERGAAARFAATLSGWPDVVLGIAAAVTVGWLVARPVAHRRVGHGTLTGAAAAALDVVILVVAAVPVEWIQVLGIASTIAAGAAGGSLAERTRAAPPPAARGMGVGTLD